MYYEDVDWSLRMADAGWGLAVVPAAVVVHDVPRRGGRRVFSDGAIYFMTRNRLLVAARRGRRLPAALAGGGNLCSIH
jgi:GT2 family glycosyltransferase